MHGDRLQNKLPFQPGSAQDALGVASVVGLFARVKNMADFFGEKGRLLILCAHKLESDCFIQEREEWQVLPGCPKV